MSKNNNSIHILRGTRGGVNENTIKSTKLYDGQLYFDRGTRTLQVGDKYNSTIGSNTDYVTVNEGAITRDKIQRGAITDDKINDSADIKGSKLADADGDESNPSGITTNKIEDFAITSTKISSNAVTTDKINNNAVTTAKIENKAVTEVKIKDDAVTTNKIKNNSIIPAKLKSDEAFSVQSITARSESGLSDYARFEYSSITYRYGTYFGTLKFPPRKLATGGEVIATEKDIQDIDARLNRLGFKSGNFVVPNGTITVNTITRQGNYVIGKLAFSKASILGEQHKEEQNIVGFNYWWTVEIPISSTNFYSSTEKALTAENLIWEVNFTSEGGDYERYISGTPKIANNKLIITSNTVEDTYLGSEVTYGNCYLKSMTVIFGYEADPIQ